MAARKLLYFIFGINLISKNLQAQIKVFFEPEYNFYKRLGSIDQSVAGGALVQPVELNLGIEGGLAATIRIKNHVLKTGYRIVEAGLNWKIKTPYQYVQQAGGRNYNSSLSSSVGLLSNQFHLGYSYMFKTRSFLPLYNLEPGDPNQKYLFRFSWFTLSGASVEWYLPTSYHESEFSFSGSGIDIQERVAYRFLRRNNFSVLFGGGIQFFHKNKERLKISLVYSHALFRFYEFPITVTFDAKTEYQGLMSTRGSIIGLFVSYPFLV